jgi:hypothetical protein
MINKPLIPNSSEEWSLEMEVFNLINNSDDLSESARSTVQKLWGEVVRRETWYFELRRLQK